MRIGLIDVDGHNFPNFALMKLSAWHKEQGDTVEWWFTDLVHYDIVYMSKVFSSSYSPDVPEPLNADKVVKGGTGYAIDLIDGLEVYDKAKDPPLPPEVEAMCPDYSIYPDLYPDTAIGFLTRGCPRGCKFCHVAAKEGRKSIQVADVSDFYKGQGNIEIMDPNILANKNRDKLLEDLIATKAKVNFNQGLDIRLASDGVAEQLGRMRIKRLHFAWDNPKDDLTRYFEKFGEAYRRKAVAGKMVYVLTNFGSTQEEDLWRIYTLRDLGFDPYVMIYDKANAPREVKRLQRWCNNKFIFKSCKKFEDYR